MRYVAVIFVLLVVVGAFLYYHREPERRVPVESSRSVIEETPDYAIDVKYPFLTGIASEEAVNREIKKVVDSEISAFKDSLTGTGSFPSGVQSSLEGTYKVALLTSSAASIEFIVSSYTAGAAHPNSRTVTLSYDLILSRPLTLADLFAPGKNYLEYVASLAQADLVRQFTERGISTDSIESGAAPTEENYKRFLLTKDSLVIVFDPYQVAAYAAGGFEVRLPYQELENFIFVP